MNDKFSEVFDLGPKNVAIATELLIKAIPYLGLPENLDATHLHAEWATSNAIVKIFNLDESVRQEFGFYPLFAGYIRDYAKEIKP